VSKSVFCIAATHREVETLVDRLRSQGFAESEISVLLPDTSAQGEFDPIKSTKATEGAAVGATTGGVAGGALALFAGLGALAIPGAGPFVAAGPIVAALSGVAIGATTCGVVGGLIGLGIPEPHARRYEERLTRGHFLLAAHGTEEGQVDRAEKIFQDGGGEDISRTGPSENPRP
jgi:hypothetical protein